MISNYSIIQLSFNPSVEIIKSDISDHSFPAHYHKRHCVGEVLSGEMILNFDGIDHLYKKGDRYVIPSFKNHSCKTNKIQPVSCMVVCFRENDDLRKILGSAQYSEFLRKMCALSLLNYASACHFTYKHHIDRIQAVINVINSNYAHSVSIESLAEHVQLSCSRLQHFFKSCTGISLKNYIIQEKLRQSKYKLPDKSMSDIVYECGFYDQSHFIHQFKKYNGLSPLKYKNAVQIVN